jgi:peptidoglycan/LPS O-acetylase OafA/YrhL
VFLVIWALERWNVIQSSRGYGLVFTLACVLYLNLRGWSWLGLEGAIYLMPYFLVGLAVSRFKLASWVACRPVWLGLAALALCGVLLMGMPVPNPDRRTLLMLITGISLCLLLISWNAAVSWLENIGRHSYAIYLFHVFFTAALRIGLERLKIDGLLLPILFGILLGLAGPILVDWIASKFKWSALLLLGKSVKSRPRAVVAPEHLVVAQ